jgi:hypothetical protein
MAARCSRSTYIACLIFFKCLYAIKLNSVKSHLVKSQFCDFLAESLIHARGSEITSNVKFTELSNPEITSNVKFTKLSNPEITSNVKFTELSNPEITSNVKFTELSNPGCQDRYAASRRQGTNTQWRRVTSQTNGDLTCTVAEAWHLASLVFALTSDAEIQSEFYMEIILIRVQCSLKLQFTVITQAQFYAPETGLMKVCLNWL